MPDDTLYVLHPGTVKSRYDGDIHHIPYRNLMWLYGLQPHQCIHEAVTLQCGYVERPNTVHLYPRYDGDYRLPEKKT